MHEPGVKICSLRLEETFPWKKHSTHWENRDWKHYLSGHTQSGISVKLCHRSDLGVFMYNLLEGLSLVMSFRLVMALKPRGEDEVNCSEWNSAGKKVK